MALLIGDRLLRSSRWAWRRRRCCCAPCRLWLAPAGVHPGFQHGRFSHTTGGVWVVMRRHQARLQACRQHQLGGSWAPGLEMLRAGSTCSIEPRTRATQAQQVASPPSASASAPVPSSPQHSTRSRPGSHAPCWAGSLGIRQELGVVLASLTLLLRGQLHGGGAALGAL